MILDHLKFFLKNIGWEDYPELWDIINRPEDLEEICFLLTGKAFLRYRIQVPENAFEENFKEIRYLVKYLIPAGIPCTER
jgi:hypothetical protein